MSCLFGICFWLYFFKLSAGHGFCPALFLLYVNDLPSSVKTSHVANADDTKLFSNIKCRDDAMLLQTELQSLEHWSSRSGLAFNETKLALSYTVVIFLGDFSILKIFLIKLSCYHDNYFKYFMLGKYNGFVSKERVSACLKPLCGSSVINCLQLHYRKNLRLLFSIVEETLIHNANYT
jgi:hypothetical protein